MAEGEKRMLIEDIKEGNTYRIKTETHCYDKGPTQRWMDNYIVKVVKKNNIKETARCEFQGLDKPYEKDKPFIATVEAKYIIPI